MERSLKNERERGLATVEMAIVLPLLILLTLGAIEYGWMFLKAQQVTNASRQGARAGAPIDGTDTSIRNAVDSVMAAAGLSASGYTVSIPTSVNGLTPQTIFSVTVSVPYANITLIGLLTILPAPTNLRSVTSMAKEGI